MTEMVSFAPREHGASMLQWDNLMPGRMQSMRIFSWTTCQSRLSPVLCCILERNIKVAWAVLLGSIAMELHMPSQTETPTVTKNESVIVFRHITADEGLGIAVVLDLILYLRHRPNWMQDGKLHPINLQPLNLQVSRGPHMYTIEYYIVEIPVIQY